jgi:hypothetical protein
MGFLNFNKNRRTIRGPVNEMDKSTIISIFPRAVHEVKPTIQPGVFDIPAGTFIKPATLTVGTSSWWREIDENQPLLEIPISSVQVADSVVRDYCNGLLGFRSDDMMPGLFYLPGVWTAEKVQKEHAGLLQKYNIYQRKWFMELIRIADILWARSNFNPLAISDDARLACNELGIKEKAWLKDFQSMEMVACKACGNPRNPLFPVCPVCHAISDPELAKKLNIQFATP